jgi:uncharacterized protein (DUF2164 family)
MEKKGKDMEVAIGMMLFIFFVANKGGLYFYFQARKDATHGQMP